MAINNGLASLVVASLAMAPSDPNLAYAGTGSGIYKTVDGGATWSVTGEPVLPLTLAMDPTNPNILYAGFNGDLQKTTDGGDTWLSVAGGLGNPQVFSLAIDPSDPNVVYAGTTGAGAFKTTDGGISWTPLDVDSTVWSLLVDPDDGNVVYAGSNGNGVFKSTDAGASFVRIGSPGGSASSSRSPGVATGSTLAQHPRESRSAKTVARRGRIPASRTVWA